MATVGRMVFPDFVVCMWEERAEFALSVSLWWCFSNHRRTSTGCHVSCVPNLSKTKKPLTTRQNDTPPCESPGYSRRSSAPLAKSFANMTTRMYHKTFMHAGHIRRVGGRVVIHVDTRSGPSDSRRSQDQTVADGCTGQRQLDPTSKSAPMKTTFLKERSMWPVCFYVLPFPQHGLLT